MKKLFKTFLITFMAVCAACMCAFALTACSNGGSNGGSDDDTSAKYVFEIKNDDGTAYTAEETKTQICLPESAGGTCVPLNGQSIYPENGTLTLTQTQINTYFGSETDVTVFLFHVLTDGSTYDKDCGFEVNGAGTYTCTLKKTATA